MKSVVEEEKHFQTTSEINEFVTKAEQTQSDYKRINFCCCGMLPCPLTTEKERFESKEEYRKLKDGFSSLLSELIGDTGQKTKIFFKNHPHKTVSTWFKKIKYARIANQDQVNAMNAFMRRKKEN